MHSSFLKEMGITEWTSRDHAGASAQAPSELSVNAAIPEGSESLGDATTPQRFHWWFFGDQPQGDAQILFQNIIRLLGLTASEWTWLKPTDLAKVLQASDANIPVVAMAFGSAAVQKITGERDSVPQLRETVLAMSGDGNEEIPVLASFELTHFLSKPKDKALLWQDLLLAKSVLLNI
ncbi:DNA polymerase III subunit psi [Polynucleobacter sp. AP-Latsch-80-C2]|uniref:DNA polymerase III subunit psi n=1 Tax=Polynucleobacter sp. AP-Latsch-80-C2 TaxID=2576931 RepID=UPI002106A666|nr:DNA polymerase III subunit psi [Polynucleobacter sp. AP-Latsch-80-C2]